MTKRPPDHRPRLFSTRLEGAARRVYRAVFWYFVAVTAAMTWPIYSLFGSAEPRILGLPLSLAYLAALLVSSFLVLLALYLWEQWRDRGERSGEGH